MGAVSCIYLYIYIHTYMYAYIYTYTHIYQSTYIFIHKQSLETEVAYALYCRTWPFTGKEADLLPLLVRCGPSGLSGSISCIEKPCPVMGPVGTYFEFCTSYIVYNEYIRIPDYGSMIGAHGMDCKL